MDIETKEKVEYGDLVFATSNSAIRSTVRVTLSLDNTPLTISPLGYCGKRACVRDFKWPDSWHLQRYQINGHDHIQRSYRYRRQRS